MFPYNATAMPEQLPLLEQYERIKAAHRDEIVFFRLGDFYEMFFQDAVEASALLNLTLTKRQEAPMCGVPYHASRGYIARLLKAGRKVAICEQLGSPTKGKGIIERGVVEVVSPGTAVDEDYLESGSNNYLAAVGVFDEGKEGGRTALAWLDASTGEFKAASFPASDLERLRRELYRLSPREILVRESTMARDCFSRALTESGQAVVNRFPDWSFSLEQGRSVLTDHFRTAHMRGFGFEQDDPALAAAGMVLSYMRDCLGQNLSHVAALRGAEDSEHLAIDEASQKNLELVRNLRDGGRAFTLLDVMDYTRTAMGSRELRRRLLLPLRSPERINARLDAVDALYRDQRSLERVRRLLASCLDLERLASRLAMNRAGPRDLLAMRNTIRAAFELEGALPKERPPELSLGALSSPELEGFAQTVDKAIMDEPAAATNEGGFIRELWNAELDAYRALKSDAHGVLERYLEEERRATGLSGLRVKYNRVLGYFLELSKNAAQAAPAHFIRRQSTSGSERFSTEKLGELESRINGASERIVELERNLFEALRESLRPATGGLQALGAQLARLDCAASMAALATARAYVRPTVDASSVIEVKRGRHPVVEAHLGSGQFVPNDLCLDAGSLGFALITGPNMAGKSTFLRQNALIAIMAQAGSFVPAEKARVGVADRLFCRVGAQDNLARGESTFLLEMHETAGILNNAGASSLVVMDEVGRGTGTQDGLAIAWAVSEHLLDSIGCRTLFATHYHELTAIRHPRLMDLSMAVDEREGDVVFLRRVVQGPAAGSYGIHVAALAGIPPSVVARAEAIRGDLASREAAHAGDGTSAVLQPRGRNTDAASDARAPESGSLFSLEELVLEELKAMDLNGMTPLDAMNRLAKLKKSLSPKT